jgi:hypothetical protein
MQAYLVFFTLEVIVTISTRDNTQKYEAWQEEPIRKRCETSFARCELAERMQMVQPNQQCVAHRGHVSRPFANEFECDIWRTGHAQRS